MSAICVIWKGHTVRNINRLSFPIRLERAHKIMSTEVVHKGSCHCGKVTFQVLHSPNLEVDECNCSICDMKGKVKQKASSPKPHPSQ